MLATKRLRLRAIEESDLETLARWKSDPDINEYFHEYAPLSLRNQREWYERQLNDKSEINLVAANFEGVLVGTAGLMHIDMRSRKAELARILIGERNRRNAGVGSQIVLLIFQYAFEHLNLHKLYGQVLASNETAIRFYKGFGSVEEGVLREHVFKNGRYEDVVCLAYFRDTYEELSENGVIKKLKDRYL